MLFLFKQIYIKQIKIYNQVCFANKKALSKTPEDRIGLEYLKALSLLRIIML